MLSRLTPTALAILAATTACQASPLPKQRSNIISGLLNQWIWVNVPGTMCSDGSQTGFALNAHLLSTDLLINFQEGGVCYDNDSCYVQNKAYNMGTPYNGATFAANGQANTLSNSYALTARFTSDNPFYQANMAWVPYCTGDLHAGNATVTYPPRTSPTYHHGFINGKLIMQAIKNVLPNVQRVWVSGSSAGGFGAVYQYPNAVSIFGSNKRVDLIVDSAEEAGSALFYPSLNIQLVSPSICPACDPTRFDSFLPGYAAIRPNSRFAALSFQTDNVLPGYEGVDSSTITSEIASTFTSLSSASNAKGFIAQGTGHVVFGSPLTPSVANTTLSSFVTGMVNSATWTNGF